MKWREMLSAGVHCNCCLLSLHKTAIQIWAQFVPWWSDALLALTYFSRAKHKVIWLIERAAHKRQKEDEIPAPFLCSLYSHVILTPRQEEKFPVKKKANKHAHCHCARCERSGLQRNERMECGGYKEFPRMCSTTVLPAILCVCTSSVNSGMWIRARASFCCEILLAMVGRRSWS